MSAPIAQMAGVCGWPIHHSLSPVLHNFWLRKMGISGAYVPFAVRPDEAVEAFQSLKHTSIKGVNVTIPLKQLAFEAADHVSDEAARLGVVNCLYRSGGELIGHNTDLEGFLTPLLNTMGPIALSRIPAMIIGTGGAARAVVGALLMSGCPEIRLCGRRFDAAHEICSEINVPSLYAVKWDNRHDFLGSTGLLINASAGGMRGKSELDIDLSHAPDGCFVYDLIYTPLQTGLLRQAAARGLAHIGGLDMLIEQARPSFAHFFGQTPPPLLDPKPVLLRALGETAAE